MVLRAEPLITPILTATAGRHALLAAARAVVRGGPERGGTGAGATPGGSAGGVGEEVWGEGNLQASLGMHDPNPRKSKTSSPIWVSPKNCLILASAMTQSGVLGKEMKVYVDNINM